MILQLTNPEFQQIRMLVGKLNCPEVTREFNSIFNKASNGGNSQGMTGFVNPANNDIIINIPETCALKFIKVLARYAPELGNLINSPSIGIMEAPRLMSMGQAFLTDLVKSFT